MKGTGMKCFVSSVLCCSAFLVASRIDAEGTVKTARYDSMPQMLIPAGEFVMGADDDDAHGRVAESPPHKVYLDAYWIDRHEVTNAQYVKFLNQKAKGNLRQVYSYCDIGNPVCRITYVSSTGLCEVKEKDRRLPVVAVSRQGAWAYARHMRRRLPTEAEWEKAARGADQRRYPWGGKWSPRNTNTREAGPGQPLPVESKSKDRSPYGVHDMAGNVREWVQDVWDERFYLKSPERNPLSEGTPSRCVVRGGAWCLTEWDARVTSRQPLLASAQRRYMGFRCAESFQAPLPVAVTVSKDVLFYAPMDGAVHAAAAQGERRPLKAPRKMKFVTGRRGKAALLGEEGKERYWVDYDSEGNIRLEEGTIALWIQPIGWNGSEPGFRFFFMLRDQSLCKFYLYRFMSGNLLALAGNGIEHEWGTVSSKTQSWKDGQWIHLAVTWKGRSIALYVDGKPAGKTVIAPEKYFRGLPVSFSLGQSQVWDRTAKRAQTAFDEFVIFSRALKPEEVAKERDRKGLP